MWSAHKAALHQLHHQMAQLSRFFPVFLSRFSLKWLWNRDNVRPYTSELLQQLATFHGLMSWLYGCTYVTDAPFGNIAMLFFVEL